MYDLTGLRECLYISSTSGHATRPTHFELGDRFVQLCLSSGDYRDVRAPLDELDGERSPES